VAINCFSGDAAQLKAFTEELNSYVVITGLLCNLERSVDTTAALTATPTLDRLLVGSDAPYLTPFTMGAPFPKCNVPETLPHVVARIAEITRCDVATLCETLTRNARKVFRLPTLLRSRSVLAGNVESVTHALNTYPQPAPEKREVKPKGKASVLPEGVSESDVLLYNRKFYRVSEKERSILEKQQATLEKAQFEKLLGDFALEVVAEQPAQKNARLPSEARARVAVLVVVVADVDVVRVGQLAAVAARGGSAPARGGAARGVAAPARGGHRRGWRRQLRRGGRGDAADVDVDAVDVDVHGN
jgi:hypothetical protein